MKSWLLKAGIVGTLLLSSFPVIQVSAQTETDSSCARDLSGVPDKFNPSYQQVNSILTSAALEANIPPEVVKSVACQESTWRQFDSEGNPLVTSDGGIGIMQITNYKREGSSGFTEKDAAYIKALKNDLIFNIKEGLKILNANYSRTDLPKIKGAKREIIESWYFPVMAYNGIKPVNSPLYQEDGTKNTNAYQEKVFSKIVKESFLGGSVLAKFPFKTSDFSYDRESDENIVFNVKEYTLTGPLTTSAYLYKARDRVIVTENNVSFRDGPSSSYNRVLLTEGTFLIVNGNFVYDSNKDSQNHFVWYPVKSASGKLGYISSAYVNKTNPLAPVIDKVTNKATKVTGKTESKATLALSISGKHYKTVTASEEGNFSITIPVQNTGTEISAVATDRRGNKSPARKIKVTRAAPNMPTMNTVTNKTTLVLGKTEANAKVTLYISGKSYKAVTADKYGAFKIPFTAQNAGTVLTLTAKDAAGKVSAPKSTKALKVAPNSPSVSTVDNKDFAVSGKTEANATVTVAIAGKKYVKKADKYGNFKIGIPVQNWGTKISVTAKDSADRVSAAKSATVVRIAPNQPVVNKVRYYSTSVTGKTEKYATITVKVGTRTYTAKANVYGNFSVKIPKYRVGTKMYINAKDSKGKISVTRTVTVS
ncbi:Ig-like domain-containing protein [Bacillus sp. EB01]|uniref:Ig-like domain-containing protein n=1 Tax=Bacillus sp. EB01 TaxID=1347086 RepID=UPI000A74EE55|nr:Ig-like domain-containing protein [Bacillus sp. EB01]